VKRFQLVQLVKHIGNEQPKVTVGEEQTGDIAMDRPRKSSAVDVGARDKVITVFLETTAKFWASFMIVFYLLRPTFRCLISCQRVYASVAHCWIVNAHHMKALLPEVMYHWFSDFFVYLYCTYYCC